MHEMGIALQIIDIVKQSIPDDMPDCTVQSINIETGTMASIVPDSLVFCFDVAAKETVCEGAVLNIMQIPSIMSCSDCNLEWTVEELVFECPTCHGINIKLTQSTEIDIKSIEID